MGSFIVYFDPQKLMESTTHYSHHRKGGRLSSVHLCDMTRPLSLVMTTPIADFFGKKNCLP
ncbi:MAG: hypothetical protein D4R76_08265 [Methylococcus sp.]|nr:MAG: hypothetical protein D4R76_08265 [Methylococcus sp.]